MKIIENIGKRLLANHGVAGGAVRWCMNRYESTFGPIYAQRSHTEALERGRSIVFGLDQIKKRWPDLNSAELESPVFILSAGWRSGSTLLQRLMMSRQSILVWGEPYSHAKIISHLANGVATITQSWPEDNWFVDQYDLNKIDSTFVANMYPPVKDMQNACISYMKALLEVPSRERGYQRWGLKDVRLTIEDAYFIKWLFPNARFVFLCRNPYNAYRSYRLDRSWYSEWPDAPVFTARQFGQHWRSLADGFYHGAKEIGGIFLRYEDLLSGETDISALETYLDLELDPNLLKRKVGSHKGGSKELMPLEVRQLKNEVKCIATMLGYEP